jgi:stress-induced morphogen
VADTRSKKLNAEELESKIRALFVEAEVIVRDQNGDGYHFEVVVISDEFNGLSRVRQHQKVLTALSDDFKDALHALSLKTYTKESWKHDS